MSTFGMLLLNCLPPPPLLQMYAEYSDVGGGDAGDPGSLGQRNGINTGELVAAFVGKSANSFEVKSRGDGDVFAAACRSNLLALTLDITLILALDFDLFDDGAGQRGYRSQGSDSRIADMRSLQKVR